MGKQLLRSIPKVDELLKNKALQDACAKIAPQTVTDAVRRVLDDLRLGVLNGEITEIPEMNILCSRISTLARQKVFHLCEASSTALGSFCTRIWAGPAFPSGQPLPSQKSPEIIPRWNMI